MASSLAVAKYEERTIGCSLSCGDTSGGNGVEETTYWEQETPSYLVSPRPAEMDIPFFCKCLPLCLSGGGEAGVASREKLGAE